MTDVATSFASSQREAHAADEPFLRRLFRDSVAGTAVLLALSFAWVSNVRAQGVLTLTPGRTLVTSAGSGAAGYIGDGGAASAAYVSRPLGMAYDAAGNLFLADVNNHAIREISPAGVITTVAGTGMAGYGGDGGAATTALLDTPTGVSVDTSGNLYIADSHNHRVRKVSAGVITTIAGNGTAGFAGDGGQATAAQLDLPTALAVDAAGTLYIADTNNQRVRKVTNGVITTIAGNGDETFAGDGGPATQASLDSPSGLAIGAAGSLYIADRNNQRVRVVSTNGTISSVAGSGASSFSGAFSGDGGSASGAALAKPSSVSVDTAGNIFIADTGNQRIRQISGGVIATIAGSGDQGFEGDGGALTGSLLNAPRSILTDATGNLLIADSLNQRVRSAALPLLSFASQAVGLPSTTQSVTLANTGTASLTVSQVNLTGSFMVASGGTCSAPPITLPPGASCTENLAFLPSSSGAASGSATLSGSGLLPQTVLLSGIGVQGTTTIRIAADNTSALLNQPVAFTATVVPAGAGMPGGTVTFYDRSTQLGTAQALSNNTASIIVSNFGAGTHSITAVYSGNASFGGSNSAALAEYIADFDFSLTPGAAGSGDQTVIPGQPATYALSLQPLAGPFNFPVTLSATGLPPGATIDFSSQTVTVGASAANFTMTIHTAKTVANRERPGSVGGGTLALALLLLPFSSTLRRRAKHLGPLAMLAVVAGGGFALTLLTGCGQSSGFFGQPQKTYTIQIVGTAQGSNGATLQHVASVKLTVE